jgi:hypothetical protein
MSTHIEYMESQHTSSKELPINIVVAKCCSISHSRNLDTKAGMLPSTYQIGGI